MAGELKDHRIPVMMAATDVATIDEWRRSQEDLPNRSEAIRRLVELGLKANAYQAPRWNLSPGSKGQPPSEPT